MSRILIVLMVLSLVLTGVSLYASEEMKVDAKVLFEKKCGVCHGIDRPKSMKKTAAEWESTILQMKKNGAALNDEEAKIIIKYLSVNYGK